MTVRRATSGRVQWDFDRVMCCCRDRSRARRGNVFPAAEGRATARRLCRTARAQARRLERTSPSARPGSADRREGASRRHDGWRIAGPRQADTLRSWHVASRRGSAPQFSAFRSRRARCRRRRTTRSDVVSDLAVPGLMFMQGATWRPAIRRRTRRPTPWARARSAVDGVYPRAERRCSAQPANRGPEGAAETSAAPSSAKIRPLRRRRRADHEGLDGGSRSAAPLAS